MISNGVIRHEKELDRSILEKNRWVERKIHSSTNVLSGLDVRGTLSVM